MQSHMVESIKRFLVGQEDPNLIKMVRALNMKRSKGKKNSGGSGIAHNLQYGPDSEDEDSQQQQQQRKKKKKRNHTNGGGVSQILSWMFPNHSPSDLSVDFEKSSLSSMGTLPPREVQLGIDTCLPHDLNLRGNNEWSPVTWSFFSRAAAMMKASPASSPLFERSTSVSPSNMFMAICV